jgi:NAD(P)-dependent dehydrogenase (short-subunit alcohol dehydrogenase family)
MTSPLASKIVVVTGATGQVGWGIAHAALDTGATVSLPVRSEAARKQVEREFGKARTSIVTVDFADESSLATMRDATLERFGAIDHVFAPLGSWWQKGASLDQPAAELRHLLSTYALAPWLLVKAFAPALRVRRGSYTFITGAAGEAEYIPDSGLLLVAVKAQHSLSGVLRHELAPEPFRINEIRISRRIEHSPRPCVIPSQKAGATFIQAAGIDGTGKLLRYDGPILLDDPAKSHWYSATVAVLHT